MSRRPTRNRLGAVLTAFGLLMASSIGLEAGTGDEDEAIAEISETQIAFGKTVFLTRANCVFCHGWSGDGEGAERSEAPGLSLRETLLTREQLIEVVKCGRPGTNMPYHDSFAYTDDRCYGVTADQLGDQLPTRTIAATLQRREIEAVVDYLLARIVGRGEITLAECEEFWEPGAGACDDYR